MTAALCMAVIGPFEDDPPNQRSLYLMSQDQDDPSESTPTDAAPPLSDSADERPVTQPPGPNDELASAYVAARLPPDPKLPAEGFDFRDQAERELVALYRTAIGMHESLLGASGLLEQSRRNTVEDIARVVDRGFERIWERIEPRLGRQDDKIAALQDEIRKLWSKLDDQERDLAATKQAIESVEKKLKEDAARPAQAAPPPAVAP